MHFAGWSKVVRSGIRDLFIKIAIAGYFFRQDLLPNSIRLFNSLSLTAKRLIIIVLCLSISGISSVVQLDPKLTATDPLENEYWISIGPITGSATSPYSYASIFNPSGSGKTMIAKRIRFNSDSIASSTPQDLLLSRTTAASGGTQIAAADIPRKNADTTNPVAEVRHTGVTTTLADTVNNQAMIAAVGPSAAGSASAGKDYTFNNNQLVLQPGEGIALHQVSGAAAGTAQQRIRLAVEWEEVASAPSAVNEFMLAYPRVSNAAAIDYKYHSLWNPAASGKTAVISRLNIDVDCNGAAVYTNRIYVRRTNTAPSAGTLIAAANIPKKHSGAAASVMQAHHTGVTTTLAGTATSSIAEVLPCAAANQPHAHLELTFGGTNENLILQPGEGLALTSNAAGSTGQLVRLSAVWSEQVSAPASQGEYALSLGLGQMNGNATSGYNFMTFFNPAGSGKTAVVRKIGLRSDAQGVITAAAAGALTVQRVSAAGNVTAGTLLTAADIPKKHTGTANTIMQIRTTNPNITKVGGANARVMGVTMPGAVGQTYGHAMRDFGSDKPLVLAPGEGIALFQEVAGDTDHRHKILLEWDEETTGPTAVNEYMTSIGPQNGQAVASYNYASFFNPSGSGRTAVLERLDINVNTNAAAVYVPLSIQRISAVTAATGTAVAAADLQEKHSGSAASIIDARFANPTVTKTGGVAARLNSVTTPGAAGAAVAPHVSGNSELKFSNTEPIVLQPGEGIVLFHETTADADLRIRLNVEWTEPASAPSSQGEYIFSSGPTTGSATADSSYNSFYNPSTSGKNFVVKRLEIRADRIGAGGYFPVTVRRTIAHTGGTNVAATDITEKHTGTAASSAEIREDITSATFASADTASRLMGVTSPGVVGQDSGLYEASIISGDELVLAPGEGIALYQEGAGDVNMRYRLRVVWSEESRLAPTYTQSAYRWYNNLDNITPGTALANENTSATLANINDAVRLRMAQTVSTYGLYPNDQAFKLQHATSTSGSWTDVGVGAWIFKNNAAPADGAAASAALLSGTPVSQSYTESNPTVLNPSTVNVGGKGEWDFALDSTNAAAGTTYYFRMIKSDGTALDTYSAYPQLTTPAGSNTAPNAPTNLRQITSEGLAQGVWTNQEEFDMFATMSDPDPSDTLQLCVDVLATGLEFQGDPSDLCGPEIAYSGSAVEGSDFETPGDGEFQWRARVKDAGGLYSSWTYFGANNQYERDFGIDLSGFEPFTAYDGSDPGNDKAFNDGSLSSLSANWTAAVDLGGSGLKEYQYAIGTNPGGTTVRTWTTTNLNTSVTATGLTLKTSEKYYFSIKAIDNVNNSAVANSDGVLVAPTVSFSVSPSTITFANLNAGNTFSDTKATTLTTSTNAYGGYVVRSFVTDLLRAANNQTIGAFSGGTYASPDTWQSGDTGFGYTSNDTSIQGVSNKFGSGGCTTTGLPTTCLFAPFTQTGPGDIVADHTTNLTGTPLTNQQFTVTYRATTTNTQAATKYNTSVIYTITPVY